MIFKLGEVEWTSGPWKCSAIPAKPSRFIERYQGQILHDTKSLAKYLATLVIWQHPIWILTYFVSNTVRQKCQAGSEFEVKVLIRSDPARLRNPNRTTFIQGFLRPSKPVSEPESMAVSPGWPDRFTGCFHLQQNKKSTLCIGGLSRRGGSPSGVPPW